MMKFRVPISILVAAALSAPTVAQAMNCTVTVQEWQGWVQVRSSHGDIKCGAFYPAIISNVTFPDARGEVWVRGVVSVCYKWDQRLQKWKFDEPNWNVPGWARLSAFLNCPDYGPR
jgi:hypothetical protein